MSTAAANPTVSASTSHDRKPTLDCPIPPPPATLPSSPPVPSSKPSLDLVPPPAPAAARPPRATPTTTAADRDVDADTANVSEAETEILSDAASKSARGKKEITLEPRSSKKMRGRGPESRTDGADESPRKKRRRRSRSGSSGNDADDAGMQSELSSVSSRHASPALRRKKAAVEGSCGETSRATSTARKRKARADSSASDDDDRPPLKTKLRQRRGSTAVPATSTHSRKPSTASTSSRYPLGSPNRASSPVRGPGRPRSTQPSRLCRPPPLLSARDPSEDDSSSESSRQGSPRPRARRPRPTPGSPISMAHRPKRDTAGRTLLHRACHRGHLDEVIHILESGQDMVHIEDHAGYLPIHEAALNGYLEVVKILVKYGSKFDKRSTTDKESPLLDAVENGHVDVVKYLLELGADPRKRDVRGRTPLDANREKAEEQDESMDSRPELEELLKAAISAMPKRQPNANCSDGEDRPDRESHSSRDPSVASPVHMSPSAPSIAPISRRRNARQEQSRKDLLWLDSGKGSVVKLRDKAREGDLQMVSALLETGLKPDREALIGAIKGGHTEIVSLMLAYDAEVDPPLGQSDREGGRRKREVSLPAGEETPMLAAIGRGNVTILRYLLENGVDPRRCDSRGKSYVEVAKEREGEFWQEEVEILTSALQKAGGKRPNEKSPQRVKSSPLKAKHGRRNSSASGTSARMPSKEKSVKRPVKPSHTLDDSAVASDLESATEAPPHPSKRSESEVAPPGSPKRRRRLVSGKVREQEALALANSSDTDKKPARVVEKTSTKVAKSESDEPSPKLPVKKVKSEPVEDVNVESSDRKKAKVIQDRERERDRDKDRARPKLTSSSLAAPPPSSSKPTTVSQTDPPRRPVGRPPNRERERSRSPSRAPKADSDKRPTDTLRKRPRESSNERMDHRREGESALRHIRDEREKRRGTDQGATSSSERRDPSEVRRQNRDAAPTKTNPTPEQNSKPKQSEGPPRVDKDPKVAKVLLDAAKDDTKPKIDNIRLSKPTGTDDSKDTHVDIGTDKKKDTAERAKKLPEVDDITIDDETREELRRRFLVRELSSIQKKAAKASAEAQARDVIPRELALRKRREEEEKEQLAEEERRQREREALETAEREAKEIEEREKAKQEALEKAAREKAEAERLAREKEEREKKEREEQERQTREKVAREEREAKEAEARLAEEQRQKEAEHQKREEDERIRRIEEERQSQIAQEREQKEQRKKQAAEEQCRLDLERARLVAETEKRKMDAQHREMEVDRPERGDNRHRQQEQEKRQPQLPTTLRLLAEREAKHISMLDHELRRFSTLFCVRFPVTAPLSAPATPNGVHPPHHDEHLNTDKWICNIQASLVLGTANLNPPAISAFQRRPTTEHERVRIWSVIKPMLCEEITFDMTKTLAERISSQNMDSIRFKSLQPVFWIKLSDFTPLIPPSLKPYVTTIDFALDVPTGAKGSPAHRTPRRSRTELEMEWRRKRVSGSPEGALLRKGSM
ncbi:hypothetical protein EX30DRAFT_373292 [Ascodesmis nigricans]|uniref:Ankyrin n=1 Tax=Ascodesmis nigricans TaxID=341454 RepID=A0A4S2MPN4_9PEZI|nr:hypothetical protein EX30DRAFT_373292 [Ascodesmis nigricans]